MSTVSTDATTVSRPRISLSSILTSRKIAPLVFLAPFMILFVVFKVYPIYQAAHMSFQEVETLDKMNWVGADNYEDLKDNVRFKKAVENTSVYTVGILAVLIPIPPAAGCLPEVQRHDAKHLLSCGIVSARAHIAGGGGHDFPFVVE